MSQQREWLTQLGDRVCECLTLFEESPVGAHYVQQGELFEISLFVSPTEFVGGPRDGERVTSSFVVDILQLLTVFDSIESVSCQAHQIDSEDDLGTHCAIVGNYEGRQVWLRILANSPEHLTSGRYSDVNQQTVDDAWKS